MCRGRRCSQCALVRHCLGCLNGCSTNKSARHRGSSPRGMWKLVKALQAAANSRIHEAACSTSVLGTFFTPSPKVTGFITVTGAPPATRNRDSAPDCPAAQLHNTDLSSAPLKPRKLPARSRFSDRSRPPATIGSRLHDSPDSSQLGVSPPEASFRARNAGHQRQGRLLALWGNERLFLSRERSGRVTKLTKNGCTDRGWCFAFQRWRRIPQSLLAINNAHSTRLIDRSLHLCGVV
ncbi:uncharacterized protein BDZ99DRAFT_54829 [Mytilinidion resinicola]|uniref:Uncharacterized protein n=1 Tax=Mytilinidion resinicola TaxID=574789 RepID=A0A6A6YHU0_9PEZI|nr:uncharacterized protein BDZ99DRAFT_54829 [Mytilinidion resinicola]KAF2808396.1 hypothetical protein BDZ99DRAFT_54829 [Mytilinidion resinicola]